MNSATPQFATPANGAVQRSPAHASNPAIEALRGLGALMVMMAHYRGAIGLNDPISGGCWLGVDLFFVVSGYVFGRHLSEGVGPLPAYGLRRMARIFPLYWVALWLYASASPHGYTALPVHAFMLHTASSLALAQTYNPAFWSLPVEICFYAVLPLWAWLAHGLSKRTRHALWITLGASLALGLGAQALISAQVLLSADVTAAGGLPPQAQGRNTQPWLWLHFQLPGRWLEFSLGFVAYRWAQAPTNEPPHAQGSSTLPLGLPVSASLSAAAIMGLGGALGCMAYATTLSGSALSAAHQTALLQLPWLFALCTMPLVAALGRVANMPDAPELPKQHARGARRLAVSLARLAGALSYGLYLLHNLPPLWLPQASVGVHVALSVALAWLLHTTIEAPLLAWARSTGARGKRSRAHHREGS